MKFLNLVDNPSFGFANIHENNPLKQQFKQKTHIFLPILSILRTKCGDLYKIFVKTFNYSNKICRYYQSIESAVKTVKPRK